MNGTLENVLNRYRKTPCLILDCWPDYGISAQESKMMKEIFDYRERFGGTVLISHTPVGKWGDLLSLEGELRKSLMLTLTQAATIINGF